MSSFEIINDHIRICLPQLNMTINVRHRLSILKHGDFFIFFFVPSVVLVQLLCAVDFCCWAGGCK